MFMFKFEFIYFQLDYGLSLFNFFCETSDKGIGNNSFNLILEILNLSHRLLIASPVIFWLTLFIIFLHLANFLC